VGEKVFKGRLSSTNCLNRNDRDDEKDTDTLLDKKVRTQTQPESIPFSFFLLLFFFLCEPSRTATKPFLYRPAVNVGHEFLL